jgi:hypothetical protein
MTKFSSPIVCRKCRLPFEFHSMQTANGPKGPCEVAVFECRQCGRLAAEEMQLAKAA